MNNKIKINNVYQKIYSKNINSLIKNIDSDPINTFILLGNYSQNKINKIKGKDWAIITKKLLEIENKIGGPYKISSSEQDNLELNITINYFLKNNNIKLDILSNLIDKNIIKNNFPLRPLLLYYISDNYQGQHKFELINKIKDVNPSSTSEKLLKINSLHNLRKEIISEPLLLKIEEEINLQENTSLNLFLLNKLKNNKINNEQEIIDGIKYLINKLFKNLNPNFQDLINKEINKTINGNKDKQMSLLPYYFAMSLKNKNKNINIDVINNLCVANIFFWTAFIIYDDFWDEDEEAKPSSLPVANLLSRYFINIINNIIPDNKDFFLLFKNLMNNLDEANAWEISFCRTKVENNLLTIPDNLPDYKNYKVKFYPSSAHMLGPIIVMLLNEYKVNNNEINYLINFFQNYLIAKQINDDLCDWEEDLNRGSLSTVAVMIIKKWREQNSKNNINLTEDKIELKNIFNNYVAPEASKMVVNFIKTAKLNLDKMDYLSDKKMLNDLIMTSYNNADEILQRIIFLKNIF